MQSNLSTGKRKKGFLLSLGTACLIFGIQLVFASFILEFLALFEELIDWCRTIGMILFLIGISITSSRRTSKREITSENV